MHIILLIYYNYSIIFAIEFDTVNGIVYEVYCSHKDNVVCVYLTSIRITIRIRYNSGHCGHIISCIRT